MKPFTISDYELEGAAEYQRCFENGAKAFRKRNFPSARLWFTKAYNTAMTEAEDYNARERIKECDVKIEQIKKGRKSC